MSDTAANRAVRVKEIAKKAGFDACGIAVAGHVDPEDRFGTWIARGFHADMDWLANTMELRQDATRRLPGAKSVVVVASCYRHEPPPAQPSTGLVARYAWGKDYHKSLKAPLKRIARYLDGLEPGTRSCISIDSKGVMERAWAERAGVGWVGKNSLVLNRQLGSWFVLGTVITTIELAADAPVQAGCGTCRACVDACPTQAIVEDGVVDARRCISYHTIENQGAIPPELSRNFGTWVFGCDICQEVCPWNRFAPAATMPGFAPREGIARPPLNLLVEMDEPAFDAYFAGTPVRRAGVASMRRNAQLAEENTRSA